MGIFNVRGTTEAAYQNLKRLEVSLQSWPEDLYTWPMFFSKKYGVNVAGVGSKVQVNRLRPLTAVTEATLSLYDTAQGRNDIDLSSSNTQVPSYDSVDIEVQERAMYKPLAIKKQSLVLAQQDILMHAMMLLRRNRNEYLNIKCRKTIRDSICSTIYGARRSSASAITNTSADNLSIDSLKEMRRRLTVLHARAFGGYPNSDGQLVTGFWTAIIDVNGENQLTNDDTWQTFARYELSDRGKYVQGYVGDAFGFRFFRTDTGYDVTGQGASGDVTCSEAVVMAQDPILISVGENGSQGFVGEFPCVYAQVGPVEVEKAKEDNMGRDWLTAWFTIEGFAPLERLSGGDATTLTTALGGGGAFGTAASGSSRFIHSITHSRTL